MENFRQKVLAVVAAIPAGKVMSYGQVAAAAGNPKCARQVGAILGALDITHDKIPWWRVVNGQGYLSIRGNWTASKDLQRQLLIKDGVEFVGQYNVDRLFFHKK